MLHFFSSFFSHHYWCYHFFLLPLAFPFFGLYLLKISLFLFCFMCLIVSFSLLIDFFLCLHFLLPPSFICQKKGNTSIASSSSQKRKERSPTPSEGEGFLAGLGQEEILDLLAFPLQDPWYTSSLFFPQVAHGTDPLFPHTWVFSSEPGFSNSA